MTQEQALEILKMGYNVYLTGPAGSGKTFLLNQYVDFLKSKNIGIGITASTGIAATHMNGITIHSWSGIGIKNEIDQEELTGMLRSKFYKKRFKKTKVLIIDEISMLHASKLDLINLICQAFKENDLPFGGLQIIFSGDFFQLPPIDKENDHSGFAYTSNIWNNMNLKICYLTEQFRQEDSNFLQALNSIRSGQSNQNTVDLLMTRFGKDIESDITPLKLFTHNVDADAINMEELNKINSKSYINEMSCSGSEYLITTLKRGCLAPEKLILKKGAVVMFLKNNFKEHYANGTVGKVVDFVSGYPVVKVKNKEILVEPAHWEIEEYGSTQARITQLPLRLAWAITIHKSQGMNLDMAEIDLGKAFAYGMGYVALSRIKTLNGIKLLSLNDIALQVDNDIIEIDKTFFQLSQTFCEEIQNMSEKDKKFEQKSFLLRLYGD